ncbi:hypothetical protein [Dyadobacter alkalitolerans]|uniref:hypothetical protein n=1 Tax=Dyadobacter alkalitolerans TaxID=492736 RepID=UPI0003FA5B58|nr:hypothetical protein [Dyadobacter alkalitolerans]
MQLIQIFVPLTGPNGTPFDDSLFNQVKDKLTQHFDGVTIYQRAPATGLWKEGGTAVRDEIIIYEVMAPELNLDFWVPYKAGLEKQFGQKQILIRTSEISVIS